MPATPPCPAVTIHRWSGLKRASCDRREVTPQHVSSTPFCAFQTRTSWSPARRDEPATVGAERDRGHVVLVAHQRVADSAGSERRRRPCRQPPVPESDESPVGRERRSGDAAARGARANARRPVRHDATAVPCRPSRRHASLPGPVERDCRDRTAVLLELHRPARHRAPSRSIRTAPRAPAGRDDKRPSRSSATAASRRAADGARRAIRAPDPRDASGPTDRDARPVLVASALLVAAARVTAV